MEYKIYRIQIIGNKAWRCEIFTNDIKKLRTEIANTFKVLPSKVRFCYETDEPYTRDK